MTGSEYIAEFLARIDTRHVFTLTGGACAFMIDAIGRHPQLTVICVQNEQAAAMAADAVWRVDRRLGVSMATSGPGATNLITGIACSFFDSIPSLRITGQVNQRESSAVHGANVRQSGFQETKIVEMVRPITKYAVLVRTVEQLRDELTKAYMIATSGRMGPVLIDVPMDIQQAEIEPVFPELSVRAASQEDSSRVGEAVEAISALIAGSERPVVLWGGGVGMAGVSAPLAQWLVDNSVPFVASWLGSQLSLTIIRPLSAKLVFMAVAALIFCCRMPTRFSFWVVVLIIANAPAMPTILLLSKGACVGCRSRRNQEIWRRPIHWYSD